jgi:hypothetical protein
MNNLPYHEDWGDEHIAENGYEPTREIHTDAEVLGRLCRMLDDDPLAFFVWTQRILWRDRTYDEIARRLALLNPRGVTRQAIYGRIKNMIEKENLAISSKFLMPKAEVKQKIKPQFKTFEKEQNKYRRQG